MFSVFSGVFYDIVDSEFLLILKRGVGRLLDLVDGRGHVDEVAVIFEHGLVVVVTRRLVFIPTTIRPRHPPTFLHFPNHL